MPSTIVDMFREQVARHPDRAALRTKASGQWIANSWREWEETSLAVAAGLIELGVKPGERVALFANTRREWAEVDLGIVMAGAVTVPLYQQTTPANAEYILTDSESTIVFAEDPFQIEKLFHPRVREKLKNVRRVIYFDARRRLERPDALGRLEVRLDDVLPRNERSSVMSYPDFLTAGRRVLESESSRVRARGSAITGEDLATIVYTSGTTGPAKGVALTHANFAYECASVGEQLGLTAADEQLLFLPLAHIFAKVLLVAAIRVGCATSFASSPLSALDDAQEVHPTFFGAVPRVYEKVFASVQQRMRDESPLRRKAAEAAFDVGRKVAALREQGRAPGPVLAAQYRVATIAVLEQVRHVFGRRLRYAISGGAPLSRELAEWFHACGVMVLEGYGLTETTAATHLNRPGQYRIGTVGKPIPGVEARVAPDGEVLVRGGNVMQGYFRRPDETADVLEPDGWFHTGDVGGIDAEGYLTITDRKKDLIVTAGGKNVSPQNIETALKHNAWISQAFVIGDARPYLVALITLNEATARGWAREAGLDLAWPDIIAHPHVKQAVGQQVLAVNSELEGFQHIRRWKIIERDFTVEADEVTATMKLRRKTIAERYAREIDALYRA